MHDQAAGAAGFAAALGAQRIGFGRRGMIADHHRRNVFGARQRVIHERSGDRLAALVVADFLHQRLADALRDAAMQLAFDDHRVDDGAEVADAGVAHDPRHAGVRIDLDFRDMAAIGEGRRRVLGGVIDVERIGHALRHLALAQPLRQFHDADRAVGAGDGEAAVAEFDVAFGGFHQMRRRLLALGDDQRRGFDDRRAGRGDRARAAGAVAEAHEVAVVLFERDLLEGHAELRRQHLRERGGVTLAVIQRAGGELHRTVRLEGDLAEFAARRRGDLEIGADRDAAQFAVLAALLPASGKIGVVGNLQRLVEHALEIAAVIGDAGCGRERQLRRLDEIALAQASAG